MVGEFLKEEVVAIGWNDLGPIDTSLTYDQFKEFFIKKYPEYEGGIGQSCGQIWRFIHEMEIGDNVVTYDPGPRLYYLGQIASDYRFNPELTYKNSRKVKWNDFPIERDYFSIEAKNSLGSVLTVFLIPEFVVEEISNYESEQPSREEMEMMIKEHETQEMNMLKADVISRSQEFIHDLIAKLDWKQAEQLVAGVLRAMGYKTRFTPRGTELGSDIFASPDGLGLEEPRIKVEVKKLSKDKIGAPAIRNFIGGMRNSDKGIYVSISGFTTEAVYEAERANFPITLIDSSLLVELIVENYEVLSPDIKSLIPLRRIYWPV